MGTTPKAEGRQQIDERLLKKAIKDYCFDRLGYEEPPKDLKDDTDLFEAGIIDSVDALELLIGFEEDYGIIIPEELEDVSGLATINGIFEFILDLVDPKILEEKLGSKTTLG